MKGSLYEDRIYKISAGILIIMASGLVGGTTYIVQLSNASDDHQKAIAELQNGQGLIQQMATDIAVIKSRLDSIDKKLDQ